MKRPKRKLFSEISEWMRFVGDAAMPANGEHDIRQMCVETISILPADVQEWLRYVCQPFFICMSGQNGQYEMIAIAPSTDPQFQGLATAHLILLSEKLTTRPRVDVMFVIAHEIAHAHCGHLFGTSENHNRDEDQADDLACQWLGLDRPPYKGWREK